MATKASGGTIKETNFSGFKIGQVMDNYDSDGEGKIKVYISSLQFDNDYDEKVNNSIKHSGNTTLNGKKSIIKAGKVTESNYIIARPMTLFLDENKVKAIRSGHYRVPPKKSMVLVYFFDGDQQKPYYFPFNPTNDGDVVGSINAPNNWNSTKKRHNIESWVYPNGNRMDMEWNDDDSHFHLHITGGKEVNIDVNEKGNVEVTSNKKTKFNIEPNLVTAKVGETTFDVKPDGNCYINGNIVIHAGNIHHYDCQHPCYCGGSHNKG